jgi:hypothetical protein
LADLLIKVGEVVLTALFGMLTVYILLRVGTMAVLKSVMTFGATTRH